MWDANHVLCPYSKSKLMTAKLTAHREDWEAEGEDAEVEEVAELETALEDEDIDDEPDVVVETAAFELLWGVTRKVGYSEGVERGSTSVGNAIQVAVLEEDKRWRRGRKTFKQRYCTQINGPAWTISHKEAHRRR